MYLEELSLTYIVQSSKYKLLLNNITKGKLAERIAELDYINNGYSVQRTGIGSDFVAIKANDSDITHNEFVEVKTGKSRPSKRQKMVMRMVKKSGQTYTIYRVTDVYLESYLNSKNMKMEVS
jgi:predicted Holliday junction resolvase-like endonuclease